MFESVRTLVLLVAIAGAVACKDKPSKQAPPTTAETPGKGSGPTAAPDLDLPHGPGTPPLRTTAPLTEAQLAKLTELKFSRFTTKPHGQSDKYVEVRQITNDFPRIMTTITVHPCTNKVQPPCLPMQLDKWKDEPRLKDIFAAELRDLPDTKWQVTTNTVHGQTVIETYQLGATPQNGKGRTIWTNAVALYFNDDINQIRVVAQYADDPTDLETMVKKVPRGDLELVARAFLDVYTHAWGAPADGSAATPPAKPSEKK
jgi:hypothetical protein